MLPLDSIKTVIVHDACADGLASALLLRDALPHAELRFVQYGTAEHRELEATPGLLFCDFSPPRARVDEFARAGAIVLDHHASAREAVAAMGARGVFGDEETEPGVCGAVLAFRHVWRPLRGGESAELDAFAERFAATAGVYDTWQTQDPRWRAARVQVGVLSFFPPEHWLGRSLAEIARAWDTEHTSLGEVLVAKQEARVARTLERAHRFTTQTGKRVVSFEGTGAASDAAESLGDDADLVVGFGFTVEGNVPSMRFSLRSHAGIDVAALARAHGGGGHTAAAGFSTPLDASSPHPFAMVERLASELDGRPARGRALWREVQRAWKILLTARSSRKAKTPRTGAP